MISCFFSLHITCRKGNSIKTRIETYPSSPDLFFNSHVEKAIPLKQGLKPFLFHHFSLDNCIVEKAIPLKQGLKH